MAAHLERQGVVTQDGGLAQKGGATWSHIQIANRTRSTRPRWIAKADLRIGCDPIVVAASAYTLTVMQPGRTVVLNSHGAPTAVF
jgi:indolepyruvate ferredoxin oxidoreductase